MDHTRQSSEYKDLYRLSLKSCVEVQSTAHALLGTSECYYAFIGYICI